MLTSYPTSPETQNQANESWWKKWLGGKKTSWTQKVTLPWTKRQSFRLPLSGTTIQAQLLTRKGDSIRSILYDLSAGGFSCNAPLTNTLAEKENVRIRFRLPMEEEVIIDTQAVFLAESNKASGGQIARFQFSYMMEEDTRDLIHEFVLKSQLEQLNPKRKTAGAR